MPRAKRTIFVSYSHEDARWLALLETALAPLTTDHRLDLWDDRRIQAGATWRREIDRALESSNAAVLLVTPAFFASDFIVKRELPVILRRRANHGLPVVWIPVSASNFELTPLKEVQAAIDPSRPLDAMRTATRNKALVEIVKSISIAAAVSGVGEVLRTTDVVTPAILSLTDGTRSSRRLGVAARQRDGRVELHDPSGTVVDVIDPPDLGRLSEPERRLIATYQASMRAAFERWQDLYPRRDSLDANEQRALRRARRQMCDDLGKIMDFLDSIQKYLPDHYRNVRFECGRAQTARR